MDEQLRRKILALLDQHRIMTIATLRPDGWPQATTVGYANEGLTLYFLCGHGSQKEANLARDDRVSLTIDDDTPEVMEITGLSMAGAAFREVDLSGARMHGVLLLNADIDGAIDGLRVNGVEVMPLIEAELDRLHPERLRLRPATPEAMRDAVDVIEELWHATLRRASALPEDAVYRSVNGEWSLAQTLRHTIFVIDAWYGHAAALRPDPFHPIGVPASFTTSGAEFGIDESAAPALGEILAVRAERIADLRAYLAEVTQEALDRVRGPNTAIGCPPPARRTAAECLRVIFSDEWAHVQFANRDLAILEEQRA